jgi:hypothetical protein
MGPNKNMMILNPGIRTPPIVTSDFLYIRFIGDRTIQEKDFGNRQKDRVLELKKWAVDSCIVLT